MVDLKKNYNNSDIVTELVLSSSALLAKELRELSTKFENDHDSYLKWLNVKIYEIFKNRELVNALSFLKIDWITIHYRTRHPIDRFSKNKEWLQCGIPILHYMEKYKDVFQVYQGDESPYITYFAEGVLKRGEPIKILFCEKSKMESIPGWLCIQEKLVEYLKDITLGSIKQGKLDINQILEIEKIDNESVLTIQKTLSKLTEKELSKEESIGLLRNACRVTFLALQQDDPEIKLPRIIILAPTYVEKNLIGGIAFIGRRKIDNFYSMLLTMLSNNFLAGLRLREEPLREYNIHHIEELNRARADFVQRIAHSLQNPLDALCSNINDAINSLKKIKSSVEDLRKSSGDLMVAFSRENVDDLLRINKIKVNIKDFVELLIFMHKKRYNEAGLILESNKIPKSWVCHMDKTAIWEVMTNLLTNAVRHARKKTVISVTKIRNPNRYIIKVSDDGTGVDPSILPKLFQAGVRGDFQDVKDSRHGYGLYLSQRVVEKHNGKLYLNKEYKNGAEFVIEIPE